jgi:hypothetical protein
MRQRLPIRRHHFPSEATIGSRTGNKTGDVQKDTDVNDTIHANEPTPDPESVDLVLTRMESDENDNNATEQQDPWDAISSSLSSVDPKSPSPPESLLSMPSTLNVPSWDNTPVGSVSKDKAKYKRRKASSYGITARKKRRVAEKSMDEETDMTPGRKTRTWVTRLYPTDYRLWVIRRVAVDVDVDGE